MSEKHIMKVVRKFAVRCTRHAPHILILVTENVNSGKKKRNLFKEGLVLVFLDRSWTPEQPLDKSWTATRCYQEELSNSEAVALWKCWNSEYIQATILITHVFCKFAQRMRNSISSQSLDCASFKNPGRLPLYFQDRWRISPESTWPAMMFETDKRAGKTRINLVRPIQAHLSKACKISIRTCEDTVILQKLWRNMGDTARHCMFKFSSPRLKPG